MEFAWSLHGVLPHKSVRAAFNCMVGASNEYRDALKVIFAASFFCVYGLALVLWRL